MYAYRTELPNAVEPGESVALDLRVPVDDFPLGRSLVVVDLVCDEKAVRFSAATTKPLVMGVHRDPATDRGHQSRRRHCRHAGIRRRSSDGAGERDRGLPDVEFTVSQPATVVALRTMGDGRAAGLLLQAADAIVMTRAVRAAGARAIVEPRGR